MAVVTAVAAALLTAWVVAPLLRRQAAFVSQEPEAPADARHCPECGPRPESDARYCSNCGGALGAGATAASS